MDTRSDIHEHRYNQQRVDQIEIEAADVVKRAEWWEELSRLQCRSIRKLIDERNAALCRAHTLSKDMITLIRRLGEMSDELRAAKGEPVIEQADPVFSAIGIHQGQGVR